MTPETESPPETPAEAQAGEGLASPPCSARDFIREAAEAFCPFLSRIETMEEAEVEALISELGKLSQTNCWFAEYWIKPLLLKEARGTLYRIQKQNEASSPAQSGKEGANDGVS